MTIGSIIGDVLGSSIEFNPVKPKIESINLMKLALVGKITDDTVMTLATWKWLSDHAKVEDFFKYQRRFFSRTPNIGYGPMFAKTMKNGVLSGKPSFGNGAAMKISPLGAMDWPMERTMDIVERLTVQTHPHPEAVKGAQSVVYAMKRIRQGASQEKVMSEIESRFGYNLNLKYEDLLDNPFDATCQGSVPQALWCALTSHSAEEMYKKALTIGGDSDTIACIAGGVYKGGLTNVLSDSEPITKVLLPIISEKLVLLGSYFYKGFFNEMFNRGFDLQNFK